MPSLGSIDFAAILAQAGSEAAGFAAGVAIGPTLVPPLRFLENSAWKAATALNTDDLARPLDPATAAEIAAELVDQYGTMETLASYSGITADRFKDLYGLTLTAPGMGELLATLRRDTITQDQFAHGLRKAKLDPMWDKALADLQHVRLTPQQLALGIVRSVVNDPGLLAVTLDTSGGVVPAYQVWGGDVAAEAKAGGIDLDRLRVMVGEIGLPMSAQQAASAYFRGIIRQPDFNRAILEGDTRPEWAPYILDQARQIPSAHDGIEYRLRGWTDDAGMYAQTARHGMSKADTDLLFKVLGRPLSFHQVFIGLRRGGVFDGATTDIAPAFLRSLQESNIRPEWYNLAWAQRYTYPTAFVLRSLTEAGDLTETEAHDILLFEGWEPTLAAKVAAKWAGGTTATGDPNVKKAHAKAWTEAQTSYIAEESTAADVQPIFALLGLDAQAQTDTLAAWDAIRALTRRQLSPKEIVKALGAGIVNPATGQPWTTADALAALQARGYSAADAQVLIQE